MPDKAHPTAPSGNWLLRPDRVDSLDSNIRKIEELKSAAMQDPVNIKMFNGDNFWPPEGESWCLRPYNLKAGILTIPVDGILTPYHSFHLEGYSTGFGYIRAAVQRGLEDEDVNGIAFLVNSPGGYADGSFECGDFIFTNRGKKKMAAFVRGSACSAAYLLASSADQVFMTKSSESGSVGVLFTHYEDSKMLERIGIKPTIFKNGENKDDGNSVEPLTTGAQSRIQGRIDEMGALFIDDVARNRGITKSHVRATKASIFGATQSVEIDFADEVGNFDTIMAVFESESALQNGVKRMAETAKPEDKPDNQAELSAQLAAATTAGESDATKKIYARMAAVQESDEYTGREVQASALLANPEYATLSAEGIIGILKGYPKMNATPTGGDAGGDAGGGAGADAGGGAGAGADAGGGATGAAGAKTAAGGAAGAAGGAADENPFDTSMNASGGAGATANPTEEETEAAKGTSTMLGAFQRGGGKVKQPTPPVQHQPSIQH